MKNSTKARVAAAIIRGATIIITLGFGASALTCDNGTTPETVQDFKIGTHSGKDIVVSGLPSLVTPIKDKIKTAVDDILDDIDADATNFKSIVANHGLKIIIEDVPLDETLDGYIFDGTNGILKFHHKYIMREVVNVGIVKNEILHGVIDNMVAMLKFNNAKETVRMANAGVTVTKRG
jgi:hypothetical protein